MNNFYKYFLILIGVIALFDGFSILLGFDTRTNFSFFTLGVSKIGYIVYKMSLGVLLLVPAFKMKKK